MNFHPGWMLIVLGAVLLVGGLILVFAPGVPLGRLPGDIRIENGNTRIYAPITTCILISVVVSAVLWIVQWLSR